MREQAEALLRLIGEDGVSRIVQGVNRELDGMVGRQRDSARASEEQSRSVLTLGERWSVIAGGMNAALELGQKAFALAVQAGEAIAEGARGLILDETFAATFLQAAEALDQLRQASSGRIADNVLEQIAIDSQRAGLSLDATSTLLAATMKAATVTGKPAADAMKELSKSIAEGTNEGFKQLGVFFDANAALDSYAKTLGKTRAELTQTEKSAALLSTGVEQLNIKFGSVTGDESLARLEKVSARWDNIKDSLKEAAATSFDKILAALDIMDDTSSEDRTRSQEDRSAANRLETLAEVEAKLSEIRVEAWKAALQAEQGGYSDQALAQQKALNTFEAQLLRRQDALLAAQAAAETLAEAERELARQTAEDIARYGSLERKAIVDKMEATQAAAAEAVFARQVEAELAGQFLDTATAAAKWAELMEAADAAQIDLVSSTELMSQTLRDHQSEMVRTLELQAEMAELAGDTAGAFAARSQAASLASGDNGTREAAETPGRRGGGGGSRREDRYQKMLAEANAKLYAAQKDGAVQLERIARDAAQLELERRNESDQLALDALVSRHERELLLEQEHQAALVESRRGGFDASAEASRGLVGALGELDGIQLSNLPNTISQFGPLLEQIEALRAGTDKSQNAMTKGAAGIVGASGKMVAGLIKNETARAAVMSLVEIAEATRSFASYDYLGGALHLVAAGQYAAVAGMSASGGGGRGGGGGGPRGRGTPELPASMQPQQQSAATAPVAYNIYMGGSTIIGGDNTSAGRDLSRLIQDSERRKTSGGAARDAAPR